MKSPSLAASVVLFAATVNLPSASAVTVFAPTPTGAATGTPYYEWQYHYGKKARFEGHWALAPAPGGPGK
jgi:hypothetical protein